jgi:hypothetical protein
MTADDRFARHVDRLAGERNVTGAVTGRATGARSHSSTSIVLPEA